MEGFFSFVMDLFTQIKDFIMDILTQTGVLGK